MKLPKKSDKELITALKKGGIPREQAWRYMYIAWQNDMYGKTLAKGATREEARKALDMCCVAFEKQVTKENFELKQSLLAYLAVCIYNRWLRDQTASNAQAYDELLEQHTAISYDYVSDSESYQLLERILEKATEPECAQIFQWYAEGYSVAEIAQFLDTTPDAVKTKKWKCKGKLKDWLNAHPKIRSILIGKQYEL